MAAFIRFNGEDLQKASYDDNQFITMAGPLANILSVPVVMLPFMLFGGKYLPALGVTILIAVLAVWFRTIARLLMPLVSIGMLVWFIHMLYTALMISATGEPVSNTSSLAEHTELPWRMLFVTISLLLGLANLIPLLPFDGGMFAVNWLHKRHYHRLAERYTSMSYVLFIFSLVLAEYMTWVL